MKKTAISILIIAFAAAACAPKKAADTKLAAGTPAYQLAKDLAAIVPEFDPDKNAVLVTAKTFSVTVGDVTEVIQGTMGNGTAQLKQMPADQLKSALGRAALQVGERKILLAAAAESKVVVTPEEIKTALDQQYQGSGGEAQFLEALKTNGVAVEFVKKTIGDDRLIQKYFDTVVFKDIKATDDEIKKAYGEEMTATVRHILLLTQNKTAAEKAEIRKKIDGLLERARKGGDFAALAKEFTEDPGSKDNGGLYEDFGRGKMVKPFEDAAFNVPVGQISDVVETTYGYHIVKVEGRKKEAQPLEQVKTTIEEAIKNRKKAGSYEKLMTDLKAKAKFVEVKPEAKPAVK
jgi:parvulin-like peptidyl-prolyl isomerase